MVDMAQVFADLAKTFPGCLVLIHRTEVVFSKENLMHWDEKYTDIRSTFTVCDSTRLDFAEYVTSELNRSHRSSDKAYVYCLDTTQILAQLKHHHNGLDIKDFKSQPWLLHSSLSRILNYKMPHEFMVGCYDMANETWVPNPDFNPQRPLFNPQNPNKL